MSDCQSCQVESECHYPWKPTECVHQRKFWTLERRQEYDNPKSLPCGCEVGRTPEWIREKCGCSLGKSAVHSEETK